MERLTLNETWKYCMSMWKWIAKQKKAGSRKKVPALKQQWMTSNKAKNTAISDCFFCEYGMTHERSVTSRGTGCSDCPAVFVDNKFDCEDKKYNWRTSPIAFYNKLVSLNRKRLKK